MNEQLLVGELSLQLETLLSLAVSMLLGLLMTRLMKVLKLPNVTGYLIAGLIVGPHLFNFIGSVAMESGEMHNVLGLASGRSVLGISTFENGSLITTVALGFIAFSIGSSFELNKMKALGKSVVVITVFQAVLTALAVDIALIGVSIAAPEACSLPVAIMLGAIATATAPAATLLVVRQYKASGPVTSTLLPVVAFDDAIGLMVFSVSFSIAKVMLEGGAVTVTSALLEPLIEIFLSLAVGAVLGVAVALSMRVFKSRANRMAAEIVSVFAGVALADMWDLSGLLVCMMIGAVYCNLHKDDVKLNNFTERWTSPLFMLFFIISGAELNLAVIPMVGIIGAVYIAVRSLGKYTGSFIGAKIVKADSNVTKYLGFTLLPQAGVAIGMATIVVAELSHTGHAALGTKVNTIVLCATLVYEFVGPLITKWALTRAGEINPSETPEVIHDTQFYLSVGDAKGAAANAGKVEAPGEKISANGRETPAAETRTETPPGGNNSR